MLKFLDLKYILVHSASQKNILSHSFVNSNMENMALLDSVRNTSPIELTMFNFKDNAPFPP